MKSLLVLATVLIASITAQANPIVVCTSTKHETQWTFDIGTREVFYHYTDEGPSVAPHQCLSVYKFDLQPSGYYEVEFNQGSIPQSSGFMSATVRLNKNGTATVYVSYEGSTGTGELLFGSGACRVR